jgi:hypothetical protein
MLDMALFTSFRVTLSLAGQVLDTRYAGSLAWYDWSVGQAACRPVLFRAHESVGNSLTDGGGSAPALLDSRGTPPYRRNHTSRRANPAKAGGAKLRVLASSATQKG